MRDLTKSMLSFSWVMPLFGFRQGMNVLMPEDWKKPFDRATAAFDAVTDAATEQLGDTLKNAFDAGDRLQRGAVDMTFSIMTLGMMDRGEKEAKS